MSTELSGINEQLVAAHARLKGRIIERRTPVVPAIRLVDEARRMRALRTCHRPAAAPAERRAVLKETGAFVPELAAHLEDDPNLCDGARRCARKIAEETYRRSREDRTLAVTVTYLARALGRCRRTVQRYLRQLEREGYIAVEVVAGKRSRMCVGLVVRPCEKLLARHHREKWPQSRQNPGATRESLNQRFKGYLLADCPRMPVEQWAIRCMDGVFRSFMKTNPLAALPEIRPA